MKRFTFALLLACALSITALAGEISTSGAPSPGDMPISGSPSPGDIPCGGSAPGEIPSGGSTAPGDIPSVGLSIVLTILDLAF